MNELPKDIGGYQHLEPWVTAKADDILVSNGKPCANVGALRIGWTVGALEEEWRCNIYRKMPVAKQSDAHEREFAEARGVDKLSIPSASLLPTDAKARKAIPLYSGLIAYFPDALCAVAELSRLGNDQHNPGKPLHWDRSKSGDEADALMRHLLQKDGVDKDGVAHAVKVAWRGLALAQKYIEAQRR